MSEAKEVIEPVLTNPDILVEKLPASPLLVDAKYRTSPVRSFDKLRVEASDLYEMLAFLDAAGTDRGVLVYPLPSVGIAIKTGQSRVFEKLEISGKLVFGLAVDVRGISERNGFKQFASGLCKTLQTCWNNSSDC